MTTLAFLNFPTLAGSDAPAIALLPWLLAGGLAVWLRRRRPEVCAGLDELGLETVSG